MPGAGGKYIGGCYSKVLFGDDSTLRNKLSPVAFWAGFPVWVALFCRGRRHPLPPSQCPSGCGFIRRINRRTYGTEEARMSKQYGVVFPSLHRQFIVIFLSCGNSCACLGIVRALDISNMKVKPGSVKGRVERMKEAGKYDPTLTARQKSTMGNG